jgi:RNA polymerase sigma-70 factor, ECF subfamily
MAESGIVLISKKITRESDELRIIEAARKDPKAFGELYKLHVEYVFRYLYSRIGNVHEAEDITAQTFLAAFESFGKFR